VGSIRSNLYITSEAILLSASPTISSIYGGALMSISGNGFSNDTSKIQVNIGLNPCSLIRATHTLIQCITPAQGNSSDMVIITVLSNYNTIFPSLSLNYSSELSPNVSSINVTSDNSSIILQISGYNFVIGNTSVKLENSSCSIINLSLTSITCTISSSLGAGHHPVIVHVDGIGDSNSDILYTSNLVVSSVSPVEGGYGGGLSVTVIGEGFNTSNIDVKVCNRTCLSVRVVSNNELICITPNVSIGAVNNACNLTVTVDDMSGNTEFTYRTNLTPIITSVSPIRGGTGGGTIITITGTRFP
jgi:hypothetical protein